MLGFAHDLRALSVLRAVLNVQSSLQRPVDVLEIYDALLRAEPGVDLTRTGVRKVLEALVNMRMVMVDSDRARRKKYSADANTIVTGLEDLKHQTLTRLEARRRFLREELSLLSSVDFSHMAASLTRRTKNNKEQPRSRLLRGPEAYREATRSEIFGKATAGSIIRVTRLWLGPFMSTVLEAFNDLLRAVEKGAELQFCVTPDILTQSDLLATGLPEDNLMESFARVARLRKEGAKIDTRICGPNARTYHFSSLNDESMVILLSEDPLAATWVSRSFNPDLVKSAIASFDLIWEQSVSLFDSPQRLIDMFPGSKSGYLISTLVRSRERMEGKRV
ncbi:MAG: hypothetical protein C4K49_12225 [Candidatus Thorarchaeota archaeon]|nr:MAG: hypothetical protein C4K49_12225 [Candidatus Thorarchaeota archaeon]